MWVCLTLHLIQTMFLCSSSDISELADHGIMLPPNMQELTVEQIEELNLRDEWEDQCMPSGGAVFKKDDIGRRNGHGENHSLDYTQCSLSFF